MGEGLQYYRLGLVFLIGTPYRCERELYSSEWVDVNFVILKVGAVLLQMEPWNNWDVWGLDFTIFPQSVFTDTSLLFAPQLNMNRIWAIWLNSKGNQRNHHHEWDESPSRVKIRYLRLLDRVPNLKRRISSAFFCWGSTRKGRKTATVLRRRESEVRPQARKPTSFGLHLFQ